MATPKWMANWNGSTQPILDAAEAAGALFRDASVEFTTRVQIDWGDGAADEDSIKDARDALRFAQPPTSLSVRLARTPVERDFIEVGVYAQPVMLLVIAKGADFDLTQRVFDTARDLVVAGAVAEAAPDDQPEITQSAATSSLTAVSPVEASPHGRLVGWIESHVGLITLVVGVLSIVVGIVIAILTT
jgi:hypothetical protein